MFIVYVELCTFPLVRSFVTFSLYDVVQCALVGGRILFVVGTFSSFRFGLVCMSWDSMSWDKLLNWQLGLSKITLEGLAGWL